MVKRGRPLVVMEVPRARAAVGRTRNPEASREALLMAGSKVFNETGYFDTNSNVIAREAGYSPGTFYTHFVDKLDLFIAVHKQWVDAEWDAIRSIPTSGRRESVILKILRGIKSQHISSHTFRTSLRVLSALEPRVREQRQAQRQRQIEWMIVLSTLLGVSRPPKTERCFVALLSIENVMDAFASTDVDSLELDETEILKSLVDLVQCLLFGN